MDFLIILNLIVLVTTAVAEPVEVLLVNQLSDGEGESETPAHEGSHSGRKCLEDIMNVIGELVYPEYKHKHTTPKPKDIEPDEEVVVNNNNDEDVDIDVVNNNVEVKNDYDMKHFEVNDNQVNHVYNTDMYINVPPGQGIYRPVQVNDNVISQLFNSLGISSYSKVDLANQYYSRYLEKLVQDRLFESMTTEQRLQQYELLKRNLELINSYSLEAYQIPTYEIFQNHYYQLVSQNQQQVIRVDNLPTINNVYSRPVQVNDNVIAQLINSLGVPRYSQVEPANQYYSSMTEEQRLSQSESLKKNLEVINSRSVQPYQIPTYDIFQNRYHQRRRRSQSEQKVSESDYVHVYNYSDTIRKDFNEPVQVNDDVIAQLFNSLGVTSYSKEELAKQYYNRYLEKLAQEIHNKRMKEEQILYEYEMLKKDLKQIISYSLENFEIPTYDIFRNQYRQLLLKIQGKFSENEVDKHVQVNDDVIAQLFNSLGVTSYSKVDLAKQYYNRYLEKLAQERNQESLTEEQRLYQYELLKKNLELINSHSREPTEIPTYIIFQNHYHQLLLKIQGKFSENEVDRHVQVNDDVIAQLFNSLGVTSYSKENLANEYYNRYLEKLAQERNQESLTEGQRLYEYELLKKNLELINSYSREPTEIPSYDIFQNHYRQLLTKIQEKVNESEYVHSYNYSHTRNEDINRHVQVNDDVIAQLFNSLGVTSYSKVDLTKQYYNRYLEKLAQERNQESLTEGQRLYQYELLKKNLELINSLSREPTEIPTYDIFQNHYRQLLTKIQEKVNESEYVHSYNYSHTRNEDINRHVQVNDDAIEQLFNSLGVTSYSKENLANEYYNRYLEKLAQERNQESLTEGQRLYQYELLKKNLELINSLSREPTEIPTYDIFQNHYRQLLTKIQEKVNESEYVHVYNYSHTRNEDVNRHVQVNDDVIAELFNSLGVTSYSKEDLANQYYNRYLEKLAQERNQESLTEGQRLYQYKLLKKNLELINSLSREPTEIPTYDIFQNHYRQLLTKIQEKVSESEYVHVYNYSHTINDDFKRSVQVNDDAIAQLFNSLGVTSYSKENLANEYYNRYLEKLAQERNQESLTEGQRLYQYELLKKNLELINSYSREPTEIPSYDIFQNHYRQLLTKIQEKVSESEYVHSYNYSHTRNEDINRHVQVNDDVIAQLFNSLGVTSYSKENLANEYYNRYLEKLAQERNQESLTEGQRLYQYELLKKNLKLINSYSREPTEIPTYDIFQNHYRQLLSKIQEKVSESEYVHVYNYSHTRNEDINRHVQVNDDAIAELFNSLGVTSYSKVDLAKQYYNRYLEKLAQERNQESLTEEQRLYQYQLLKRNLELISSYSPEPFEIPTYDIFQNHYRQLLSRIQEKVNGNVYVHVYNYSHIRNEDINRHVQVNDDAIAELFNALGVTSYSKEDLANEYYNKYLEHLGQERDYESMTEGERLSEYELLKKNLELINSYSLEPCEIPTYDNFQNHYLQVLYYHKPEKTGFLHKIGKYIGNVIGNATDLGASILSPILE